MQRSGASGGGEEGVGGLVGVMVGGVEQELGSRCMVWSGTISKPFEKYVRLACVPDQQ